MNILLVDRNIPGGIYQASLYLKIFLEKYHNIDTISLEGDPYLQILNSYNNHDLIIIHDIVLDASILKKELDCEIVYFIPGQFPFKEKEHLLQTYDHVLSPSTMSIENYIQWCFDIFHSTDISEISERSSDLLYIGRIDSLKMSIHFLAQFLKNGNHITIAGEVSKKSEEEILLAQLLEHKNVNYLGSISHIEALNLMTQYKFSVLASQTDIFSLFMLESIYQGCIPIIELRKYVEYPWVVESTYKVWNALDIVNLYKTLKSFPDSINQAYRDFHRQRVIERMSELSDINKFNQVFDN